jgi:hypothetical protein
MLLNPCVVSIFLHWLNILQSLLLLSIYKISVWAGWWVVGGVGKVGWGGVWYAVGYECIKVGLCS